MPTEVTKSFVYSLQNIFIQIYSNYGLRPKSQRSKNVLSPTRSDYEHFGIFPEDVGYVHQIVFQIVHFLVVASEVRNDGCQIGIHEYVQLPCLPIRRIGSAQSPNLQLFRGFFVSEDSNPREGVPLFIERTRLEP